MTLLSFFRLCSFILAATSAVALLLSASSPGRAANLPSRRDADPPACTPRNLATINADEFAYDKTLDIVTARGNVEIFYEGRTLKADVVSYQRATDRATAAGNVVLSEKDGMQTFAEYAELSSDLKDGVARAIRLLLADGSLATAQEGVRRSGSTELKDALFSGCDPLSSEPEATRIWQIKASNAVHDPQNKTIAFRHARAELFGVPVLYTPYLSLPDPTVRRKSGFLTPLFAHSETLGAAVSTPYYIVIDDQQDVTLTPSFYSLENPSLRGEYRGRGKKAALTADGSVTKTKEGRIRNHLQADLLVPIDLNWRTGAAVALASDPGYMKLYRIGSPTYLTNRAFVERFDRRSYAALEGYYFQSMALDKVSSLTPTVLPLASWNYVGPPDDVGAYVSADFQSSVLHRRNGPESRRLNLDYAWHRPHIDSWGGISALDLKFRGDLYHTTRLRSDGSSENASTGRAFPQATLTWRLPLARRSQNWTELLEPIVQGVIAPKGGNPHAIPNEDSLDFEFDDTNLFSSDRFTGYDRVESGMRLNYGLSWSAHSTAFGQVNALFGQSFRGFENSLFTPQSGLHDRWSDYVGRLALQPSDSFDLKYRFRLDPQTLSIQRHELSARIGPPSLFLTTSYFKLNETPLTDGSIPQRSEITSSLQTKINRYWSTGVNVQTKLQPTRQMIDLGGFLAYEDECFAMALNAKHDYTYVDASSKEAGFVVMLRFNFKSLGTVGGSLGR